MRKTTEMLTGVIINKNKQKVSFVVEGFKFIFVNTEDCLEGVSLIPDSAGYLWGEIKNLSGNRTIAIYIGNSIVVRTTTVLNAWNYIVMNSRFQINDEGTVDFPGFQGIRFTKGTLMSVNPCWALHEDPDKEKELNIEMQKEQEPQDFWYIVHRAYSDKKEFNVDIEGHAVKWIFKSDISGHMSVDKGSSLENTKSRLDVRFDSNCDLRVFYNYYGYVSALLSFLTFRREVWFENIYLLYPDQYGYVEFAECYVKNELDYWADEREKQQEDDDRIRSSMNSLTIQRLTDESFVRIIRNTMKVKKKETDLPFTVIPRNRKDAEIMTPDKIRSICSSLELEMDAAGIKLSRDDEFQKLIDNVINMIKDHRDSGINPLPDKTYQHMFKSISYWGDSLADRAILAWHDNEHLLLPWLKMLAVTVNDEDIAAVVAVRHGITHRGFKELDEKVSTTAYVLMGLIMVLALKRVAVEDEVIKDLMLRQFIG